MQQHAGGARWRAASRFLPLHTDSLSVCCLYECVWVCGLCSALLCACGCRFIFSLPELMCLTGSRIASAQTCTGQDPISATWLLNLECVFCFSLLILLSILLFWPTNHCTHNCPEAGLKFYSLVVPHNTGPVAHRLTACSCPEASLYALSFFLWVCADLKLLNRCRWVLNAVIVSVVFSEISFFPLELKWLVCQFISCCKINNRRITTGISLSKCE